MNSFLTTIHLTIKPKIIAFPKISLTLIVVSWPYLALIIAHLIWGANFIVAKMALTEFPPMSLAFLRFTLALVLLFPFLIIHPQNSHLNLKDLPRFLATGVLMVTLNIALFYLGLAKTTAATASILTMIIPIISVLLGWWFLKEHVFTINLAGILLGLIGSVSILGIPLILLGERLNPDNFLGNLLIILASIAWVIGAIISKKLLAKYSTLTLTAVIFLVGALSFALPAAAEFLKNPEWIYKVTLLGLFGLLYITILSSISAYFLFEWGLNKLGVIKADLFQYLEPIVATGLAVLVLGEKFRLIFLIGGILVMAGVYLSTIGKEKHKHHKAHRV